MMEHIGNLQELEALAQAGIQSCNNELHLLTSLLTTVQEFDPDVVAGGM